MGAVGGFDAGDRCDFTITMDLLCVGAFVGRMGEALINSATPSLDIFFALSAPSIFHIALRYASGLFP